MIHNVVTHDDDAVSYDIHVHHPAPFLEACTKIWREHGKAFAGLGQQTH